MKGDIVYLACEGPVVIVKSRKQSARQRASRETLVVAFDHEHDEAER